MNFSRLIDPPRERLLSRSSGLQRLIAVVLALVCAAAASPVHSQTPEELVSGVQGMSPASYFQLSIDARRLLEEGDTAAAEEAYTRLVEAYPVDSETWFWLGYTRYQRENYRGAAHAFERADSLGVQASLRSLPAYATRAYARADESDSALLWLEKALLEYRYERPNLLLQDSAVAKFAEHPRFQALSPPEVHPDASRAEGWRADLEYLIALIRRQNPVYDRTPLPAAFVAAAERFHRQVPDLTDEEAAVEIQRMLGMLGQSHNDLLFPFVPEASGRLTFTNLPLTLYYFPDGLYVVDARPPHEDLIGSRVVRFGTTDAADAISAVEGLIVRDSESQVAWFAPTFLRIPEVLQAVGVIKKTERVAMTFTGPAGGTRTLELEPTGLERRPKLIPSRVPGAPEPPLYLRDVSEPHWFEELPYQQAVYVQLNQVVDEREETLGQFGIRLRRHLAGQPQIQNLILDLRHNNGGNTYYYTELLRTLIAFDAQESHRLFVITGRNTFSAAQNLAVDLDRLTNAVFVGEPTGGKPQASGDPPPFILPYSGLEGELATVIWALSSPRDRRPWISPDIPVALTAEEYFGNRDPVMEALVGIMEPRESRSGR